MDSCDKSKSMWCMVGNIGETMLFGHTTDNELVFIPRNYKHGNVHLAERGDIVDFIPEIYDGKAPEGRAQAKWFARSPRLIAKKFRPSAEEWKARKDSSDDRQAAREAVAQTR
jgi:hypothetical protein